MTDSLKRMGHRVEAWIFAPGDPRRPAALRIALCLTLAVRMTRSIYGDLSHQPAALFRPISFMKLFSHMPSHTVVVALQVIGVTCALAAALGVRTRMTLPIAWLCGLVLNGMTTSIGKVVHNDVMLLLAMVPLLIAPCADAWSISKRKAHEHTASLYGWPVRVAMVVVAGAYFFTGWQKIINSGPAWFTSGNLRWVLYASSDGQRTPNPFALMLAGQAWLSHVVAFFTIVGETTFPIVLIKRKLAWIYVPAMVAMHVGILLAMRLDYTAQIITMVVVFVDWPVLADGFHRRSAKRFPGNRSAEG
ncbi:MAG: hypothetical protein NVSMB57_16360 [Actinomycetota bacterium]